MAKPIEKESAVLGRESDPSRAPRERVNLENISVVLVEPLYPGNIGSTARAMKNMGIGDLVLVNPVDPLDEQSVRMAVGSEDILRSARIFESLREALEPFGASVAASRRRGKGRRPDFQPRAMAETLIPISQNNRVALVFGREDKGLRTDETALCQYLVSIPTDEKMGSLNLSQSVVICCYELFVASLPNADFWVKKLARSENLEQMFDHMKKVLLKVGFLDEINPDRIMLALRKILGRSGLDERDVRILRGVFRDFDNRINLLERENHALREMAGRGGTDHSDR